LPQAEVQLSCVASVIEAVDLWLFTGESLHVLNCRSESLPAATSVLEPGVEIMGDIS